MADEDEARFAALMSEVKPLKKANKAFLNKSKVEDVNASTRRAQAEAFESDDIATQGRAAIPSPDSLLPIPKVGPLDVISFKRDGIQEGVYKKLRLGKYSSEAMLDLHRRTLKEAHIELQSFVQQAMQRAMRVVLVSHGKGQRDPDPKNQAVMKSHVAYWLAQVPEVMAYHSAQPQHGGVGAVYVLLKKSEKAKAENRERHGHRA